MGVTRGFFMLTVLDTVRARTESELIGFTCLSFMGASDEEIKRDTDFYYPRFAIGNNNARDHFFGTTDHMSLGFDHIWDISRRLRGILVMQNRDRAQTRK